MGSMKMIKKDLKKRTILADRRASMETMYLEDDGPALNGASF